MLTRLLVIFKNDVGVLLKVEFVLEYNTTSSTYVPAFIARNEEPCPFYVLRIPSFCLLSSLFCTKKRNETAITKPRSAGCIK